MLILIYYYPHSTMFNNQTTQTKGGPIPKPKSKQGSLRDTEDGSEESHKEASALSSWRRQSPNWGPCIYVSGEGGLS